jgi:hypothetical protein
MIRLSLVLSLLFLFGCTGVPEKSVATNTSVPEKSIATNTSTIRVDNTQCGPTPATRLELERLGETVVASALMRVTASETVIVTFFSGRDGDWSVMVDSRNGISCMVMWGKHWSMAGQES